MADPEPFGPIIFVGAESVGIPGQRRFRLKAMRDDGHTAMLWLEKEQLAALGDAIETVLRGEGYEHVPRAADERPEEPVFPLHADIEFRIGQLSMGLYREDHTIIIISIPAAGDEPVSSPGISFAIGYADAYELREQITRVIAAGRPPCPLCGGPIDPTGHICPRRNGHHAQL